MGKDVRTMSVRQLATLFDRSEQTVRRWKDKGINGVRLQAGGKEGEDAVFDEETRGGSLVFTVDAVRAFVDMNPNLLDKAAPELELILYGRKRSIFSRRRGDREFVREDMIEDDEIDSRQHAGAPYRRESRAIAVNEGGYMLRLLQKREEEIREEIRLLNQELEQIGREKAQLLGED